LLSVKLYSLFLPAAFYTDIFKKLPSLIYSGPMRLCHKQKWSLTPSQVEKSITGKYAVIRWRLPLVQTREWLNGTGKHL